MKVDESKLLKKIIALTAPMLTTENLDRNLVQINATAIVTLCEVVLTDEVDATNLPVTPQLYSYKDIGSAGDIGIAPMFTKAKEEQISGQ